MEDRLKPGLLEDITEIIEQGRKRLTSQVNAALTLVYWEVGNRINSDVLLSERAEYSKQIVSQLATELAARYGRSFQERNLRRMIQFSQVFPDYEIVSHIATELSWSHFIELLPLKKEGARMYYAKQVGEQ